MPEWSFSALLMNFAWAFCPRIDFLKYTAIIPVRNLDSMIATTDVIIMSISILSTTSPGGQSGIPILLYIVN